MGRLVLSVTCWTDRPAHQPYKDAAVTPSGLMLNCIATQTCYAISELVTVAATQKHKAAFDPSSKHAPAIVE